MNTAAALTSSDIVALSDPERTCEDASRQLDHLGAAHRDAADAAIFEESLRLKNTLDAYEASAKLKPSWEALAVLVNCEYRLYVLNQATPLRNNPFLSHWVEAVQRLATPTQSTPRDTNVNTSADAQGHIRSEDINTVRAELIKALLQSRSPAQFARTCPRQLHTNYISMRQTLPFAIGPYVRMLEEEGIYEPTPSPPSSPASTKQGLTKFERWKLNLLSRLDSEPEAALPELTHLPLELPSLDFLTTLLQDGELSARGIEAAPLIADFIQHSLRMLEAMGRRSPDASSHLRSHRGDRGLGVGRGDEEEGGVELLESGREAQTRAVRLLLLFMRNLLRKALVPVEAMYFEIQEICVRYVWVKEVREFRDFVEGGEEEHRGQE